MVRTKRNNTLYIEFEKADWEGNWARRVMNITKTIPGWKYNPKTKQWSIPADKEQVWRETIDKESVEYWSDKDFDEWEEQVFGE